MSKLSTTRGSRKSWWWRDLLIAEYIEPHGSIRLTRENGTIAPSSEFIYSRLRNRKATQHLLPILKQQYQLWSSKYERAAFNYEFLRRLLADENNISLSWSFPEIPPPLWHFFSSALTNEADLPCRWSRKPLDPSRWSDPAPPFQWDLKSNNTTLKRYFQYWIDQQRAQKGITRPNRNAGRNSTPISWRAIELMDIEKSETLPEGRQKQLSQAIKRFNKKLPSLQTQLSIAIKAGTDEQQRAKSSRNPLMWHENRVRAWTAKCFLDQFRTKKKELSSDEFAAWLKDPFPIFDSKQIQRSKA